MTKWWPYPNGSWSWVFLPWPCWSVWCGQKWTPIRNCNDEPPPQHTGGRMKLQANRFVEIYGESAIGMIIGTQAIGEYPGGLAEVVGLESDPAAPEIVFDVRHPTFGEIGVFDYETVEVIPPAPDQTTVPTPQSEADA